jgi:hypothetical protein
MIIGVFAGRSDSRTDIYNAYLDALFRVGASPVLISPAYQDDRLDEVLDVLDALLLAGGGDIEPRRYGQTPSVSLDGVDPLRDEAELRSLARMRRDGKRSSAYAGALNCWRWQPEAASFRTCPALGWTDIGRRGRTAGMPTPVTRSRSNRQP